MSLLNVFSISGTGMSAQSVRMNLTSSNIANAESVSSSTNDTYRARQPIFSVLDDTTISGTNYWNSSFNKSVGGGVKVLGVVESDRNLSLRYEPYHPMADENGYVSYPNVNIVEEMANMISASRSYQTNVDVMDTAKSLMQRILTLGQ